MNKSPKKLWKLIAGDRADGSYGHNCCLACALTAWN